MQLRQTFWMAGLARSGKLAGTLAGGLVLASLWAIAAAEPMKPAVPVTSTLGIKTWLQDVTGGGIEVECGFHRRRRHRLVFPLATGPLPSYSFNRN